MQNVNFSHHETAKNSWTSGGITTFYVGCGCTMYLPAATSGARYDLSPRPPVLCCPRCQEPHHYILCTPEKMRRVFFMHGCLYAYDVAIATLPRFCTDSWTLPKMTILGIVVHKIKKDAWTANAYTLFGVLFLLDGFLLLSASFLFSSSFPLPCCLLLFWFSPTSYRLIWAVISVCLE